MAKKPDIVIELPSVLECPKCKTTRSYSPQMDKRCPKCGHRFA